MGDKLYKFAVYSADNMECELISYPVPEGVENPKIWFENHTGERMHACWEIGNNRSDNE